MLMGKFQNSIDAKSRMIIPAKFRDELGFKCVITTGLDGCLYIYPTNEWELFVEKLSKLPMADKKARAFARHFYANAVEQEIDRQGRMTIPQELREGAGIAKELITIGWNSRIEIWSKERWENSNDNMTLEPEDVEEGMEKYGI